VASRDSIRELQTVLSSKGLYDGRIDGLNGPKTERAILLYEAELHRDGSNAADKSQLNELRGKVDALAKALTDSERERASLSNAVFNMGKDYQTDKSLRDRDLDSITRGSTLLKDLTTITLSTIALALTAGFVATYVGLRTLLGARFRRDHKAMLNTAEAKIFCRIYANQSRAFYLYYREFLNRPLHGAFKSGVALAIMFSEAAVAMAQKLPKKDPEKEELLMYAEVHRAHHYASQQLPQSSSNTEIALLLASKLYDFTDKLLENGKKDQWIACRDTLA
jgi:hypothetical protein